MAPLKEPEGTFIFKSVQGAPKRRWLLWSVFICREFELQA